MERKANLAIKSPCKIPLKINKYYGLEEKQEKPPAKFCLYARKSSESDERQALSIESQINEMTEYAKREKIKIIETKRESHSAKSSGARPVFNELIKEIRGGKYSGILAWAPDRLSRNAGDLGSLVDLMDDGQLQEIQTYNQKFLNSPNEKFLLMILCSQAKLENDNRSINVQRGMKTKCEMGYRPNMAPLGFLNNKANQTIRLDPKRAPYIKEMFEKVAFHGYTGRAIQRWLNSTDFTTRSGKKINYSTVYSMLNNPYYCGLFESPRGSGKWYKTKHKPIITREVFEEVQRRLVIHPKTWPGTNEFDYTKTLKCGGCGSGITAQEKIKKAKNGNQHRYVYYFCTKFRDPKCEQKYTREEALVEQLENLIDQIPVEKIEADEQIKAEITRFINFAECVLSYWKEAKFEIPESLDNIDTKTFAKYILRYGTREEKRGLLGCIKTNIYLKDGQIYI